MDGEYDVKAEVKNTGFVFNGILFNMFFWMFLRFRWGKRKTPLGKKRGCIF
jgi:hypothetical protein